MMRDGVGKTTTVRILATLISPTVGSALVAGIPVGPEGAAEIRKRIAVMHGLIAGLGDRGVTVFLATRRLEEAKRLCDRVLASAVGRLPSLRSGVNGQARRMAGAVAVQGS